MKRFTTNQDKIFKYFIILGLVAIAMSIVRMILIPSTRTGFWGIGLPAPMEESYGKHVMFSIKHPSSWQLIETPQGNHGDVDVFAGVFIAGRSFPHVFMYQKNFSNGDLIFINDWGESKTRYKTEQGNVFEIYPFQTSRYLGEVRAYSWTTNSVLIPDKVINCNDYQIHVEEIAYLLSFCAEEKHWIVVRDVFREMIDSFYLYSQ